MISLLEAIHADNRRSVLVAGVTNPSRTTIRKNHGTYVLLRGFSIAKMLDQVIVRFCFEKIL
jgi:hypothetical protein